MKKLAAIIALLPSIALAQTTTPTEQVMGTKIMQEVQAGLVCGVNLLAAQADLAKAQARIKELEAKKADPK